MEQAIVCRIEKARIDAKAAVDPRWLNFKLRYRIRAWKTASQTNDMIRDLNDYFPLSDGSVSHGPSMGSGQLAEARRKEAPVSKLVIFRLALAGALVAVSAAELAGLTGGAQSQLVAGGVGAVTVYALKIAHLI